MLILEAGGARLNLEQGIFRLPSHYRHDLPMIAIANKFHPFGARPCPHATLCSATTNTEGLVQSGCYQNASEVLREGLRLIEERERIEAAKLKALQQVAPRGGKTLRQVAIPMSPTIASKTSLPSRGCKPRAGHRRRVDGPLLAICRSPVGHSRHSCLVAGAIWRRGAHTLRGADRCRIARHHGTTGPPRQHRVPGIGCCLSFLAPALEPGARPHQNRHGSARSAFSGLSRGA